MAKVQILGQRCPHVGKMLIRGVFTQKVKLWNVIENIIQSDSITLMMKDDFTGALTLCTYNRVCKTLREVGRVTLTDEDGKPIFQIVDTETNQLRDWDVDEDGAPRCNPVTK